MSKPRSISTPQRDSRPKATPLWSMEAVRVFTLLSLVQMRPMPLQMETLSFGNAILGFSSLQLAFFSLFFLLNFFGPLRSIAFVILGEV